jgi:hypothetical protein
MTILLGRLIMMFTVAVMGVVGLGLRDSHQSLPDVTKRWQTILAVGCALVMAALGFLSMFDLYVLGVDQTVGTGYVVYGLLICASAFIARNLASSGKSSLRWVVIATALISGTPIWIADVQLSLKERQWQTGFSTVSPWRATLERLEDNQTGTLRVRAYERLSSMPVLEKKVYDRSFSVPFAVEKPPSFGVTMRPDRTTADVVYDGRTLDSFAFRM